MRRRLFTILSALSLVLFVGALAVRLLEPEGMVTLELVKGDPEWALGLYEGRVILYRSSVRSLNPAEKDIYRDYLLLTYCRISEGRWEQQRTFEGPSLEFWILVTGVLPAVYVALLLRSHKRAKVGFEPITAEINAAKHPDCATETKNPPA